MTLSETQVSLFLSMPSSRSLAFCLRLAPLLTRLARAGQKSSCEHPSLCIRETFLYISYPDPQNKRELWPNACQGVWVVPPSISEQWNFKATEVLMRKKVNQLAKSFLLESMSLMESGILTSQKGWVFIFLLPYVFLIYVCPDGVQQLHMVLKNILWYDTNFYTGNYMDS